MPHMTYFTSQELLYADWRIVSRARSVASWLQHGANIASAPAAAIARPSERPQTQANSSGGQVHEATRRVPPITTVCRLSTLRQGDANRVRSSGARSAPPTIHHDTIHVEGAKRQPLISNHYRVPHSSTHAEPPGSRSLQSTTIRGTAQIGSASEVMMLVSRSWARRQAHMRTQADF